MKTRAERRKNDYNKAIRKKNIVESHGISYYDNLHQYSKNKVHCSCPLCAGKTDTNSKHGMTHSDRLKIDSMNARMLDM